MNYLLLCAWALCLFSALLGYGRAVLQLLRVKHPPWALAAATGVSIILLLGGLLNLKTGLVPPVLMAVVAAGDLLFLAYYARPKPLLLRLRRPVEWPQPLGNVLLAVSLFVLLAIPVLRSLNADERSFAYDDRCAYLTLPVQTAQLDALPADPFNERRITSSLGGSYFLQSFMLVFGGVHTLRVPDIGIGFILYSAALFAVFRTLLLPVRTSLLLLLLIFIAPLSRMNLTMYVLPAALFVAIFLIEIHPSLGGAMNWRRTVLLGITAAAVSCLKSNYLPAAVLICAIYYAVLFLSERRIRVLAGAVLFGLVMFLSLLPWMLDMKAKEGTYLFPILGRGYDASAYGVPLPSGSQSYLAAGSIWVWLALVPTAGPLLLAAVYIFLRRKSKAIPHWPALLSFFLAASIAIVVVGGSTGGGSVGRYTAPFQIPALFVFIAALVTWRGERNHSPFWLSCLAGVAALAVLFLAALFGVRDAEYLRFAQEAGLVAPVPPLGVPLDFRREPQRLRAVQAAIPPAEPVLAHLLVTFPFDFKRNPIFVADWIGMAGLPPGMPIGQGPEALRSYLLAHRIRYVAYDPTRVRMPIVIPGDSVANVLRDPYAYGRYGWTILQCKVAEDEEHSIAALAKKYRRLYDDGEIYVLDLKTVSVTKKL